MARGGAARWSREHPLITGWGVAGLLALLSGVLWPTIPSYDPFSWVVWGHALFSSTIPFSVGGGPSWKPLPLLFTAIYGRFGSAAPWLWVVTARAGGIAGLFGAARLSWLMCRQPRLSAWTPWVASMAAVVAIVLTGTAAQHSYDVWSYFFFRGTSEVFLIGLWLWGLERLFCGRHAQAYALLCLEGLMRPEAWPFLCVYGAYLFWTRPRLRIWVVLGLALEPAGWFLPPWLSTGNAFLAATHAADFNGQLGNDWFTTVVSRGATIQLLPALGLAGVAAIIGIARRQTMVLWLTGLSVAWWTVVILETADGYPGLQRFYLPAAAMICVLAGYGLVQIASWIGGLAPARASLAGLATALIACVASWHWLHPRWTWADLQEPTAALAVHRIGELDRAIRAVGGLSAILPCASSVVAINHSLQTAMAWELGTDLDRVVGEVRRRDEPTLAFVGPADTIDGVAAPIAFPFATRTVATVGAWRVEQVFPKHERPSACVGS